MIDQEVMCVNIVRRLYKGYTSETSGEEHKLWVVIRFITRLLECGLMSQDRVLCLCSDLLALLCLYASNV